MCRREWPIMALLTACLASHVSAFSVYRPRTTDPLIEPYCWQRMDELTGKGYRCMAEDTERRLWFGVEEGVLSYDGLTWTSYTDANGVGGQIRSLCVAPDGRVFAANAEAIYRYDGDDQWRQIFPKETTFTWDIRRLSCTPDGRLWAGTANGFLKITQEDCHFYAPASTLNNGPGERASLRTHVIPLSVIRELNEQPMEVLEICPFDEGSVIVKYNQGLIQFNYRDINPDGDSAWQTVLMFEKVRSGVQAQTLLKARDNTLWSLLDHGKVTRYTEGAWHTMDLQARFGGGDVIVSLVEAADGSIWVGGQGNVFVYKDNTWAAYFAPDIPISASSYTTLFATSDGRLWVGGLLNSVVRLDYTSERWYTLEDLNFHGEMPDGKQWFITKTGRVVCAAPGQSEWVSYGVEDGLMDTPVTLYLTKDNNLYAAGSQGQSAAVSFFTGTGWQTKVLPHLSWGIDYRSVHETQDGALLFGAGVNVQFDRGQFGGVMRYVPSRGEFESDAAWETMLPTSGKAPYGIGQTSDGLIWMGGAALDVFDRSGKVPSAKLNVPQYLDYWVDYLHVTPERHLWIGSRSFGLYYYDGEQWSHYDTNDGLTSNAILAMCQLADGSLLAGTAGDICRFDGVSWTSHVLPEALCFARESGEFRQSADGAIWINLSPRDWKRRALNQGLYRPQDQVYRTVRYRPDHRPPITRIIFNEERVSQPGNAILSWTGTDPWNITPKHELAYSYRMDDGPWSAFTPETQKVFLSLPDGQHRFSVRARDKDFNVDPMAATTYFRVIAPLWRQPWFVSLLGILVSGIGLQTVRVLRRDRKLLNAEVIRQKHQELQHIHHRLEIQMEERQRAESALRLYQEKLRALGLQLSRSEEQLKRRVAEYLHDEICQNLAFAKMKLEILSDSTQPGPDQIDVTEISNMLAQVLDGIQSMAFELASPVLSQLGLEKGIEAWSKKEIEEKHHIAIGFYADAQPKPLDDETKAILFRSVRELLANSVKHAQPSKVSLSISREEDDIVISVQDDGVGFDPDQLEKEDIPHGFGLFSIRLRLQEIGGTFVIKSQPGRGCQVILTAPVKTSARVRP